MRLKRDNDRRPSSKPAGAALNRAAHGLFAAARLVGSLDVHRILVPALTRFVTLLLQCKDARHAGSVLRARLAAVYFAEVVFWPSRRLCLFAAAIVHFRLKLARSTTGEGGAACEEECEVHSSRAAGHGDIVSCTKAPGAPRSTEGEAVRVSQERDLREPLVDQRRQYFKIS